MESQTEQRRILELELQQARDESIAGRRPCRPATEHNRRYRRPAFRTSRVGDGAALA